MTVEREEDAKFGWSDDYDDDEDVDGGCGLGHIVDIFVEEELSLIFIFWRLN